MQLKPRSSTPCPTVFKVGTETAKTAKKPRLTAPTPVPNTATPAVRQVELPAHVKAKLETEAKKLLAKEQQGGGGGRKR